MPADATIVFKTSDNKSLTTSESVLQCSKFICHLLEETCSGDAEPIVVDLPNISHSTLSRVIEFAEHEMRQAAANAPYHVPPVLSTLTAAPTMTGAGPARASIHAESIELSAWEEQFCKVDQKTLFDIMMAANFLDIQSLLDVTCKSVAQLIRGKSPEQIRQTFNIANDFTPEEEERIRLENEWCLGTRG